MIFLQQLQQHQLRDLQQLQQRLPVGVEISPIYQQHNVVDDAISEFFVNLVMSVAIVIGVLWLFMGWRIALTVGPTLLLTVMGTLFLLAYVFSPSHGLLFRHKLQNRKNKA